MARQVLFKILYQYSFITFATYQYILFSANFTVGMNSSLVKVTQDTFGVVSSTNQTVNKYTLTNQSGAKVELISYGAAVTGLWVPDKNGKLVDVVLGFDDLDGM